MTEEYQTNIVRAHATIEVTGLNDDDMNKRLDHVLAVFMEELVRSGVIEVNRETLDKVTFNLTALIRKPNEKINSRPVIIREVTP